MDDVFICVSWGCTLIAIKTVRRIWQVDLFDSNCYYCRICQEERFARKNVIGLNGAMIPKHADSISTLG